MESLSSQSEDPKKSAAYLIRHSQAGYKTHMRILESENPHEPIDKDNQVYPDLTEAGIELARNSAEELFNTLNPATDDLFIVSSDEARAIETANVYRLIGRGMGFSIFKPEHSRSALAEKVSEGEIRVLKTLSMEPMSILLMNIFSPPALLQNVNLNWENVPEDTKTKWEKAHQLIKADDRGSWGANFYHHSEAVSKIFPEIKSAKDLYESQFKNLLRLVRFALAKAEASGMKKNLKVLAFGHENYMGHALNEYFGDHQIKNCESISIEMDSEEAFSLKRSRKKP